MNRRDDRADREAELKPERDVQQDADERQDRREHALASQILPDGRPDDLGAGGLERSDVGGLQRLDDLVGLLAQRPARFLADARHTNHVLAGRFLAVSLDDGVLTLAWHRALERGPDLTDESGGC